MLPPKNHRFRGGLLASRPTFVSPRKLRISFPILRHGFAVPPPLPKEANVTVRFLGSIINVGVSKKPSGFTERLLKLCIELFVLCCCFGFFDNLLSNIFRSCFIVVKVK